MNTCLMLQNNIIKYLICLRFIFVCWLCFGFCFIHFLSFRFVFHFKQTMIEYLSVMVIHCSVHAMPVDHMHRQPSWAHQYKAIQFHLAVCTHSKFPIVWIIDFSIFFFFLIRMISFTKQQFNLNSHHNKPSLIFLMFWRQNRLQICDLWGSFLLCFLWLLTFFKVHVYNRHPANIILRWPACLRYFFPLCRVGSLVSCCCCFFSTWTFKRLSFQIDT